MKSSVSFISLALILLLGSCATSPKPEPTSPEKFGLTVKFVPSPSDGIPPTVQLVRISDDSVLASETSLFSPDAVQAVGKPTGDSFVVLASPSGNTVLVHEDASDASPDEQIILFRRSKVADTKSWQTARYCPPHRPGPVYGWYAYSVAINDDTLFHRFLREELAEIPLEKLRQLPEGG